MTFTMLRRAGAALTLAAAVAATIAPASVRAHGGEDHGAPPPTAGVPLLPRTAAESDDFELVAVLEPGRLLIWIDRHATNEPVAGASVTVEGALAGAAAETAPGVYALPLANPPAPGHHALTLTVEAGATADLLAATLDVPEATAAGDAVASVARGAGEAGAIGSPVVAASAAAVVAALVGAAAVVTRRRRTAQPR